LSQGPRLRARYLRHRLLQLLEDARAARVAAEGAREEIPALRAQLEESSRHVAKVETSLATLEAELQSARGAGRETHAALEQLERELQRYGRVLELLYEEEADNLRRLHELRSSTSYRDAFTHPQPLVSVIIPTYLQHGLLVTRAIPSVLDQTYREIEVVVVGDGAPEETARAIGRLDDARVRYENLTVRGPYPVDPGEFWRVAGTPPWNAAWKLAKGSWIAPLNDDDAFRPNHIELLLRAAREQQCEVAYGAIAHHHPDGTTHILNSWPPESHRFGWQAALVHSGLGFMPMQLGSGALGVPGDWSLCRRMRRAGVRFTKLDDVVVDYHPSRLWSEHEPEAEGA
jgi:Glycosyl transferase family 2